MANITVVDDYNSSFPVYNLSSATAESLDSVYAVSVSIAFGFVILTALSGNCLVIAAFCYKRKLRKPTNFFMLNLAVADITLATLILPFSAVYDVLGRWLFGSSLCLVWTVLDVLVSTASILTLVAISADRYIAIR